MAGALANRIGQPSVFGEILAGLILGPTALDVLGWPIFASPGPGSAHSAPDLLAVIRDFADVGVILLMNDRSLLAQMARSAIRTESKNWLIYFRSEFVEVFPERRLLAFSCCSLIS